MYVKSYLPYPAMDNSCLEELIGIGGDKMSGKYSLVKVMEKRNETTFLGPKEIDVCVDRA